jgi:hypothetical protein
MRRLHYHSLPGISIKDPNYYDGANYSDRGRFAQPVSVRPEPVTGQDDANVQFPEPQVDQPSNDYWSGEDPSPFKLGG